MEDNIMRYGMWTSYLYEYSPEKMVKTFAEKGWMNLELSTEHGEELLERGDPETEGNRLREYAKDLGVTFPQGHLLLQADIVDPDQDKVIDTLKRWLDLFYAVGIRAAVLHSKGFKSRGMSDEEIRIRQVSSLRRLTKHIENTDMYICLENLFSGPETSAEGLIDIIEETGEGNLGICLDTGHLNVVGGNQEEFIRTAKDYLKALHIADNEGKSDQHLMPFGRGTVDWESVFNTLKEVGYNGLYNLEIPGETMRCPLDMRLLKLDYIKEMMIKVLQ